MERKVIKVPKKYTYLNELKDAEEVEVSKHFKNGLPVNCLFDKGKTGCGGTTVALTNDKDTIIAMPYVATIKNKVIQSKQKKEDYPFELFGIYANVTDYDILDYINTHEVKKLLVTYDSLNRLIEIIPNIYNDYYLLVDEYHVLFTNYQFRDKAVKNTLFHSKNFKEVTYMTATPIEEEFRLKELSDLPVVAVEWEDVVKPNILSMATNLPINKVCELIKDRINGKTFNYNLHFFINSVDFIAQAINKAGLTPEQVRVICSENTNVGKGKKTNQKKLGVDY